MAGRERTVATRPEKASGLDVFLPAGSGGMDGNWQRAKRIPGEVLKRDLARQIPKLWTVARPTGND
jgi:hypothetical protein